MRENAYKRWFRQQCADDGLDLGVADALRTLRAGSSVKGGGWKRLLDLAARDHMRSREAQRRREQANERGRAA